MFIKRLLLSLCLAFATVSAVRAWGWDDEKITTFNSDITVHVDGSMNVVETITVNVVGYQIHHGIFRDFPTYYKDRWGHAYVVGFTVTDVRMDGHPVNYKIESRANGKRVYIGDAYRDLEHGLHTFTINYTTTRQIGFFDAHDELYWNVTGNGWIFPIEQASATVNLPRVPALVVEKMTREAYTGCQGARGTAYTSAIANNGVVSFKTTERLSPHEGLTIVVTWPKGVVIPLTTMQKVRLFFQDNVFVLVLLAIFLLFLLFCLNVYRRKCRSYGPSTIIPLFYPPKQVSAGGVYYLKNFAYDHKALAAEIVDMARAGYFTIDCQFTFFSKTYRLINNKDRVTPVAETNNPALHNMLYERLFRDQDIIELDTVDGKKTIAMVGSYLQADLEKGFDGSLVLFFRNDLILGIMCASIAAVYPIVCLLDQGASLSVILFGVGMVLLSMYFYGCLKTYTPQGKEIIDQIDGFKMYLEVAEVDRMKLVGTPPVRTPELYEKYLPYAMALGVEAQWSSQFAPIFDQMKEQGHAYFPLWYTGYSLGALSSGDFSRDLSRGFSQAIASSATPPGSSSGSGGRGSSGGGGGGGGGGGW